MYLLQCYCVLHGVVVSIHVLVICIMFWPLITHKIAHDVLSGNLIFIPNMLSTRTKVLTLHHIKTIVSV